MDHVISILVGIVILAVSVAIIAYVIPWLKRKGLIWVVDVLVEAADKLAENQPLDKKAWVVAQLVSLGVKVNPFVEACIESAVKRLDIAIGMASTPYIGDLLGGSSENKE